MARPQSINDPTLLQRLGCVFREVGYDGASLALLSKATGLQRASLYHRFPGGKQQMADEVIGAALAWFEANVFAHLRGSEPPGERLGSVIANLDSFYASGRQACLLNLMAAASEAPGPFAPAIKTAFEALIAAFAGLARNAGHDVDIAQGRAERTVMLLHGSLVLSRGLGSSASFQTFLRTLDKELLGDLRVRPAQHGASGR